VFFTDRQLKILSFIHSYAQARQVAPTLREIAAHFGISKVTALAHLRALEKKRVIRRTRHQRRSIELIDGPAIPSGPPTRLPIAGELRAGETVSYGRGEPDLDVASLVPSRKNGHVLRVVGDHLAPAGLADGDLLIIEPRATPSPGEFVLVALDGGRALLGRFSPEPIPHLLLPGAAASRPIRVDPAAVRGIVRALIRDFTPRPVPPTSPPGAVSSPSSGSAP
jgi:repressor LexA